MDVSNLDIGLVNKLLSNFTYTNPNYFMAVKMGYRANPHVKTYFRSKDKTKLFLPRGGLEKLSIFLRENNIQYKIIDARLDSPMKRLYKIRCSLKDYQIPAVKQLVSRTQSMLLAPTGSGKTIMGLAAIGQIKQNTIIIVHRKILMDQWLKEIKKYFHIPNGDIGAISGSNKKVKPITVAMLQTLQNFDKQGWDYLNEYFGALMIDECFTADTKVLLSENTHTTIKNVVDNPQIKEILSYNENTKIVEKKHIVHKFKIPCKKQIYIAKFKEKEGTNIVILKMTEDQKVWTDSGYVAISNMKIGTNIKYLDVNSQPIYVCNICGYSTYYHSGIGGHKTLAHHPEVQSKISKAAWIKYREERHIKNTNNPNYGWKSIKARKTISNRMLVDNPMFKQENRDKVSKTLSDKMQNDPIYRAKCLKNYLNAPVWKKGKITKPEKIIISMNIEDLIYGGNGDLNLPIKGNHFRIPDFMSKTQKKIVEVGDMHYWHNQADVDLTIKEYESIGYKCLYLSADEVINTPDLAKEKIVTFLHNHTYILLDKYKMTGKCNYVYDIEVEDNHNFFANNILVSNCQHSPSSMTYKVGNCFKAKYRYGLTAEYHRKDKLEFMIFDLISHNIVNVSGEVSKIDVKYEMIETPDFSYTFDNDWTKVIDFLIATNPRNELICNRVKQDWNKDRHILVITERVNHAVNLYEMIKSQCDGTELLIGESEKDIRDDVLDRLKASKSRILVATRNLIAEGVDIPILDCVHLTTPTNNYSLTKQMVGRVVRDYPGKTDAWVRDYVDINVELLKRMSKHRIKFYDKIVNKQ